MDIVLTGFRFAPIKDKCFFSNFSLKNNLKIQSDLLVVMKYHQTWCHPSINYWKENMHFVSVPKM